MVVNRSSGQLATIVPEGEIIDVFSVAGLKQPAISIEIRSLPTLAHCFPRSFTFYVALPARSILSDQFPAEVRGLKYKNVAAEDGSSPS
jgi:hypothetical protein